MEYIVLFFSTPIKNQVNNSNRDVEEKKESSLHYAELAQIEIDKLWNEGILDQNKLDELRLQHLRTTYQDNL